MAFAASVILLFSFTADDSYIVMRYAENFAETGSLSFNIGERICMFTSPIQPFIEALLYKITNQTLFSYKIFSFILLMASVIIIYKMFTGEIFLQLYILSVLLLSPPIILWTSGGLETPILLFITTLISMLTIAKEQPNLKNLITIYLLAGIAFVTRYDASLFVFPVVLFAAIRGKKITNALIAILPGLIIPMLWLYFSFIYFGDIFPTSFYRKPPSFRLHLLVYNAIYIIQYLAYLGIIPFLFLLLYLEKSRPIFFRILLHMRLYWGMYMAIAAIFLYGLTMATTHMMFSFRYFVPYIPTTVMIVSSLYKSLRSGASNNIKSFSLLSFLTVLIALQLAVTYRTYKYSINGFSINGEFNKLSIESYNDLMKILDNFSIKIANHWAKDKKSEVRHIPRITTLTEGLLAYKNRDAYVVGNLASYRHNCEPDIWSSADYIFFFTDSLDINSSKEIIFFNRQWIEINISKELVAYERIFFNGGYIYVVVEHNNAPLENKLPPLINGNCT